MTTLTAKTTSATLTTRTLSRFEVVYFFKIVEHNDSISRSDTKISLYQFCITVFVSLYQQKMRHNLRQSFDCLKEKVRSGMLFLTSPLNQLENADFSDQDDFECVFREYLSQST